MAYLFTAGGSSLTGNVKLQGSKNAVLPIMAASILCSDECVISNCPDLSDVRCALDILNELGCSAKLENNVLTINSKGMSRCEISSELMKKMRSSVMFAGAMLSRCGSAIISRPGGCEIGARPIDMHLSAFRKLGAYVKEESDKTVIYADKLCGTDINLPFPSVGATENIMLASCVAEGETTVYNAAKEPEIVDLQNFLNKCGACVSGGGSDIIHIKGVKKLHGTKHTVIPDRIACATYIFAAAAAGGDVTVENCNPFHLEAVCDVLEKMNCIIYKNSDSIRVIRDKKLKAPEYVKAGVYPYFPTDAQPLLAAAACVAEGKTIICDNVFPDRFGYTSELKKLGADIEQTKDGTISIGGKQKLNGTNICAKELRGGAALIIASLAAMGESMIDGLCYIDRGYEHIENNFSGLGAKIIRK